MLLGNAQAEKTIEDSALFLSPSRGKYACGWGTSWPGTPGKKFSWRTWSYNPTHMCKHEGLAGAPKQLKPWKLTVNVAWRASVADDSQDCMACSSTELTHRCKSALCWDTKERRKSAFALTPFGYGHHCHYCFST